MSTRPITWSNSSLSLLQNCGEAFRRRYLEREFTPMGPRALRGVVVHRVATKSYKQKLAVQTLPTIEEARDTAADEFERAWQGGVAISDEELVEAGSPAAVRGTSKDFAVDLSAFHTEHVAPAINPIGVERKITVKPRDAGITILGHIDLIDSAPDGEVIRDLKTSEKSPFAAAADTSQQLTMYAMIRMAEVGKLPAALVLDHLVRTPVRAEKKHVAQSTTRDRDDVVALVNRINRAVEAVGKGIFVPADPSSWLCSKAYCSYWTTCPYTRRSDRPKN